MKVRGRRGIIQGPLLMGEDFEAEALALLGEDALEEPSAPPAAAGLEALRGPAEDAWTLPKAPQVEGPVTTVTHSGGEGPTASGTVLYLPPFGKNCRTVGLGTGGARAAKCESDLGRFDVSCAAGPGGYCYTVSSPCLDYHADADGWVSVEIAVVLWGTAEAEAPEGAAVRAEVGLFAAGCWPKEKGKYWQAPLVILGSGGERTFENEVLLHQAYFPVEKDVEYSVGTGLTTLCMAPRGAAAWVRLWGRLVYALIRPVAAAEENPPF
ncbi:MAG: hypothetical protein J7M19_00070 [Planctomycetes bacterium]|nr:hypothetical protein [Planctomycetota bacterium]